MDEKPRAFDVTKELFAKAETAAGALDQARDVRHDELAIVEARHAEIRSERRERVVRDLRTSTRKRGEERGFPGIRQTREPHVGEELELEVDLSAFALAAVLGDARRATGARRETGVPFPPGAAARHDELLGGSDEIGHPPPCLASNPERSWRGQVEPTCPRPSPPGWGASLPAPPPARCFG